MRIDGRGSKCCPGLAATRCLSSHVAPTKNLHPSAEPRSSRCPAHSLRRSTTTRCLRYPSPTKRIDSVQFERLPEQVAGGMRFTNLFTNLRTPQTLLGNKFLYSMFLLRLPVSAELLFSTESILFVGDINDELPDAPWHLQDGPPDVDQPWNWHEEIDPSDVDQPLDSESQPVGAAFQPFGPDTELVWPPQLTVWPTHWKQLTYRQRVEIKTLRDTANWKLSAIASAYNTTKATVSRTCKRPATPIKRGCPKRVIDTPIRKLLAARSALNADHRRMPFSKIARLEGVDASDMTLRSAFALEGIFRRTARKKPYLDTTQKANRLIFAIAYADWTVRCFRVFACAHVHVSTR